MPHSTWREAERVEVPAAILKRLGEIRGRLPDVQRDGSTRRERWRIRNRTFLTVHTRLLDGVPVTRLQFRSAEPEFHFLIASEPRFERAGWGDNVVNMYLESDDVDWAEVRELLTESYCVMAPKFLAEAARGDAIR